MVQKPSPITGTWYGRRQITYPDVHYVDETGLEPGTWPNGWSDAYI